MRSCWRSRLFIVSTSSARSGSFICGALFISSRPVRIIVSGVWNSWPASMKKSRRASSSRSFSVRSCSTIMRPRGSTSVVASTSTLPLRITEITRFPSGSSSIWNSSPEGMMTSTDEPRAGSSPPPFPRQMRAASRLM